MPLDTLEGVVIDAAGDLAKVKTALGGECAGCSGCTGCAACAAEQSVVVTAKNTAGAKEGQKVRLEIKKTGPRPGAAVIILVPLLAAFIGAALGGLAAGHLGISGTGGKIAGGIIFFIFSIAALKLLDMRIRKADNLLPKVVSIIE